MGGFRYQKEFFPVLRIFGHVLADSQFAFPVVILVGRIPVGNPHLKGDPQQGLNRGTFGAGILMIIGTVIAIKQMIPAGGVTVPDIITGSATTYQWWGISLAVVAGLVAITPAAGFVNMPASLVIGLLDPTPFYFYLALESGERAETVPLPESLDKAGLERAIEAGEPRAMNNLGWLLSQGQGAAGATMGEPGQFRPARRTQFQVGHARRTAQPAAGWKKSLVEFFCPSVNHR